MNERLEVHRELPLAERVSRINNFIETTGRATAQQLIWLSYTEKFFPKVFEQWDKKIDEVILENVETLGTVCEKMSQYGERLFVPHPLTMRQLTVEGFGYSTELKSYQVCVTTPVPHLIPLESALVTG